MRKNKKTPFAKSKAAKRFAKNSKKKRSSPPKYESLREGYSDTVRIEGTFSGTEHGYGFVTADESFKLNDDIFIPARHTGGAFTSDRVAIGVKKRELKSKGEKFHAEGEVIEILERGVKEFCGTLILDTRLLGRSFSPYRVIPDNPRLGLEAEIDDIKNIDIGNKVEVKLLDYGKGPRPPKGEIVRDLGKTFSLGANYESVLFEHGIRTEFPIEAIRCAEEAAKEPITEKGRLDLRDKVIFTIDGADAKDLDDAISLDVTENGYTLGVHIADVSHYVRYGTPTDKEAFARGTSVYFTDKVVPMLPKCLSNGVCSLNADTDKYTLSAIINLSKQGEIIGCRIENSIIRSVVRGVYSEVNDLFLNKSKSRFYKKYKAVYKTLTAMYPLYEILATRAKQRGVLELESTEARFVLDDEGRPIDIIKRERGDAEKLIEQFMLTANEAVARYMCAHSLPSVFRVHEAPSDEKLDAYKSFVHNAGLSTVSLRAKKLTTSAFEPIMQEAAEKGMENVISRLTLRAQMKAKYSEQRDDHFGLGLSYYCHFTSPIRRYPDLTVHRILKYAMANGEEAAIKRYTKFAAESAAASSDNELKAMTAERDIEDLYKVIYMENEVGKEFDAVISSVTSFGLFCELENTCEGFVPVEVLGNGFKFREETLALGRGNEQYKLGQAVRIRITDANVLRRRIYMEIIKDQ
ncbi:MAG: ribonuclease R [Clostridia bacterium]|nr:ribonuclease R [Clostridia bacterium]